MLYTKSSVKFKCYSSDQRHDSGSRKPGGEKRCNALDMEIMYSFDMLTDGMRDKGENCSN